MRVWVDFTNSPHVLVLRPVIERLRDDGHDVQVTARDFAQTLALCERFGIEHTAIGHHRGRGPARQGPRTGGALDRSSCAGRAATARSIWPSGTDPTTSRSRPRCCGSHAPRRSTTSGPPCSTTSTAGWRRRSSSPRRSRPSGWTATARAGKLARYPGLKEEYYLADFEPDPRMLAELGLDAAQPIAVVRTPPAVSLYHRFENDLFGQVLDRLRGAQTVVLPRTPEQRAELARAGGFIVPERAIDAQSLIAYADLVVSAGGTMNREAVALGTPVFTVFEGRLGAVDERLIADGRLARLQSAGPGAAGQARARLGGRRSGAPRSGLLVDLLSRPAHPRLNGAVRGLNGAVRGFSRPGAREAAPACGAGTVRGSSCLTPLETPHTLSPEGHRSSPPAGTRRRWPLGPEPLCVVARRAGRGPGRGHHPAVVRHAPGL